VNRHERLTTLLELLTERESLAVEDAAELLSVSTATVRRDMDHLAQQQLLVRTHGGAVAGNVSYDLPLRYKTARHAEEKGRIGQAAARLVQSGMVVGLNGGTTTTEAARAIALRGDAGGARDAGGAGGAGGGGNGGGPAVDGGRGEGWTATVVTNALNIASELTVRPRIRVVVTGGVAREKSYELIGPLAGHILEEVTLDLMFLGVDALHHALGATAHHEVEASTNRLMASRAQRVVVLADSSKLDRSAFARICHVREIQLVITDSAAPDEVVRPFEEQGVEVVRV
jgi:DeoR family transcriptional regulator, aga operon transcriptional repressor